MVKPPRPPLKVILKERRTEFLLIAGIVLSFMTFGVRAYLARNDGVRMPLAELVEGKAERQPAGVREFRPVPLGTQFYDLDAIWVPDGATATLALEAGVALQMNARSLAVLRRPFKGNGKPRDRVVALAGKMVVLNQWSGKNEVIENKPKLFQLIGKATPEEKKVDATLGPEKISPANEGMVLVHGNRAQVEVPFTWRDPVKGFLVVGALGRTGAGAMAYASLNNQSSARVLLNVGSNYEWKLVAEDGSVRSGPHLFALRPYTPSAAKEVVRRIGDAGRIVILME